MKTPFLTLLLFAACVSASAQKEREEKSNGFRGGWHYSDLSGDVDADPRHGYYLGYYRNWVKVPLFTFSTGLEANTAGAEQDSTMLKLMYLTLPVNGRVKLGPVYGDLGFDMALKIGEKFEVNGEEVDISDDQEGEAFDVLGHVGVGFKFLFLGVEARYRYALTEVYEDGRNTGLEVGLITFF